MRRAAVADRIAIKGLIDKCHPLYILKELEIHQVVVKVCQSVCLGKSAELVAIPVYLVPYERTLASIYQSWQDILIQHILPRLQQLPSRCGRKLDIALDMPALDDIGVHSLRGTQHLFEHGGGNFIVRVDETEIWRCHVFQGVQTRLIRPGIALAYQ